LAVNLIAAAARRSFVIHHTALGCAKLVPSIKLHLASEITPLWQASEAFLETHNISPPFWAFAWPGSEALAWYVTANPGLVAGLRVLDFAAGSGLAAIACAKAGAARVAAAEIDPLACAAIRLNAGLNDCQVAVMEGDIVGQACAWDVILCGDVCYEAPMTRHILPWLRQCADAATVIIADPGRAYAPPDGCTTIAGIDVPTSLDLEDATSRRVTLLRLLPAASQGAEPLTLANSGTKHMQHKSASSTLRKGVPTI
jgi:predicted nicotinamide N-methyase